MTVLMIYRRPCLFCGEPFINAKSYAKYCSPKCRVSFGQEKRERTGRRSDILRKYGLSVEQYRILSEKQNDLCAICYKKESMIYPSGRKKLLSVDHCHITGKIRGLLCSRCNAGIGQLLSSVDLLKSGITYLEKAAV